MKINKKKWTAALLFAAVLLWAGIGNPRLAYVNASPETTYQGVDYEAVFDAGYYAQANPDVAAVYGDDQQALLQHFAVLGIREGRLANAAFNINQYITYNQDLIPVLGTEDISLYYLHYIQEGKAEGRKAADMQQQVYNAIIAQKTVFPEGMHWTNDNYCAFKGGIYIGGYGCAGFAFAVSDAAFGELPVYIHYDYNNIKVGDILRINEDSHSVIVLEVHPDDVVVAEGNYNSQIHWGRSISRSSIQDPYSYIMSRYPQ